MPRRLVVQLAFAVLAVLAAPSSLAQDRPDAPKPETLLDERARARKAPTLLRALIGLTRYQGEKKVASVPYTVLLTSDSRKVRLRMGVEVPIAVALGAVVFGERLPPFTFIGAACVLAAVALTQLRITNDELRTNDTEAL